MAAEEEEEEGLKGLPRRLPDPEPVPERMPPPLNGRISSNPPPPPPPQPPPQAEGGRDATHLSTAAVCGRCAPVAEAARSLCMLALCSPGQESAWFWV